MPSFFKHLSLNIKLNVALILSFGILLIALLIARNVAFGALFAGISEQRLTQETFTLQEHFDDVVSDILGSAQLLSQAPGLVEAVDADNTLQVQTSLLLQSASLRLDEVRIINADGGLLSTLFAENAESYDPAEERLLSFGLNGIETVELVSQETTTGNLLLAGVVPVKNRAGVVVGALLAGRVIDPAFMDALDFSREDTHVGFIYEGRLIAADLSKPGEFDDIDHDQPLISQALRGQPYISDSLENDSGGTPDAVAYMPLKISGTTQAVLGIRTDLKPLLDFQDQITGSAITMVSSIAILSLGIAVFSMRLNVTLPLGRLRKASEQIAAGDLKQRAPVQGNDEIGQLALSFNNMADQVNDLVDRMQQRVEEAQEARARAERSEQVKSAFLASMSHELRTPLNAVINFTQFVIDGDTGPVNEDQSGLLTEVVGSARHLLNLINDVLDMSKIEADSLNLFVEDDISVNALVESSVAVGRGLLDDKPVQLITKLDRDLPFIQGDRQRIYQILLNVVSNACKFTEKGEIRLRTYLADNEIIVSVADTGAGIVPEDQPAVFEAFKQTKNSLRQAGGTGLGMPIARSLAEAHGGRLWLESEPGKGTTFYLALPLKSEIPVTVLTP